MRSTTFSVRRERAVALLAAPRGVLGQLAVELLKAESLDGGAVREALSTAGRQPYCGFRPSIPTGSASPTRWRDMA